MDNGLEVIWPGLTRQSLAATTRATRAFAENESSSCVGHMRGGRRGECVYVRVRETHVGVKNFRAEKFEKGNDQASEKKRFNAIDYPRDINKHAHFGNRQSRRQSPVFEIMRDSEKERASERASERAREGDREMRERETERCERERERRERERERE
eukprot:1938053-Pleurochrysis_carterae.AAC.3